MRRLSVVLLLLPLISGCDEGLADAVDGGVEDRPLGDAAIIAPLTRPNPTVGLDQLQIKGHLRSDWYPRDILSVENQNETYRGIERRALPRQLTAQDARVFHLGFHFQHQDFEGGTVPGYEWGPDESMCSHLHVCLDGVARDEPTVDWVGPVVILLEHFDAPFFDPDEIDLYSREELRSYGYPYESYMYQLEQATQFVPREQIFTPADLRGGHATLREAVLADGWPSLEALDGKFIFVLLDRGEVRDTYLEQRWSPRFDVEPGDPRIFVAADSTEDDFAAFFSRWGADGVDDVAPLVEQGFMVHGAAEDDVTIRRYEAAGAHFLTAVHIDEVGFDGPGRCNPARAGARCYEPFGPGDGEPEVAP